MHGSLIPSSVAIMSLIPDCVSIHSRARSVRRELYGEQGVPHLAEVLGIPPRTWENFEAGVAIPGHVVVGFLALTGVDPGWLRTGEGEPYASRSAGRDVSK
jgi:hypothetical protein